MADVKLTVLTVLGSGVRRGFSSERRRRPPGSRRHQAWDHLAGVARSLASLTAWPGPQGDHLGAVSALAEAAAQGLG